MVFKPRQKRSICNIQISLDNQNIVKVKEANFLGVILDENLNWKSEISHVANKVAKSISIISRCSFFLPKSSLRMLYYSLIYPYFYYCNIVWASTYKTNLRRLVILLVVRGGQTSHKLLQFLLDLLATSFFLSFPLFFCNYCVANKINK